MGERALRSHADGAKHKKLIEEAKKLKPVPTIYQPALAAANVLAPPAPPAQATVGAPAQAQEDGAQPVLLQPRQQNHGM